MAKPITRAFFALASVSLVLWANHDFLDGSYAGPHWLKPIDFLLTQCMWISMVVMMWDGVKFQEGEPLISIKVTTVERD